MVRKARAVAISAYGHWARRSCQARGLAELMETRPVGALRPEWSDLWYLYRLVRTRKPNTILEFGSGCSTVVLACAVKRNRRGILYSVETDPGLHRVTLDSLPPALRDVVVVALSSLEHATVHGVPVFRHRDVPVVVPDLLYLDGPALTAERQVAVDPLDLEDRFPPGFTMVVDGRLENVAFLRRHLRRPYSVRFSPLRGNTTFTLRE